MGVVHPLLRLGIYEDLRTRLRSTSPHYICLVAVTPPSNPQTPQAVYPAIAAPVNASGASASSEVVGTVEMALRYIHPCQLGHSQFPYLSNLAVASRYRREGSASQLLLTCEHIALQWGFQDIYLHVLENNPPARRLYYKMGYRVRLVESSLSTWLLKQPRRMLLHKKLGTN